jgi:ribonuclease HI
VLVDCSIAKAFWFQISADTGIKLPVLHPETWAHDLTEGRAGSDRNQATIIIGMYSLWMQRNKRRHGEHPPPVRATVQWAIDLAFDLGQVQVQQTPKAAEVTEMRWEKPPLGWVKCNTDGAFHEQQGQGATGAVLRNDSGGFLRGGAKWYNHCLDALSMEALACRDGLTLALQAGFQKVWLETDCQEVVKLWQAGVNQRSSVVSIIREIRELSTLFQDFKFSFVSRSCNKLAHALAKKVTGNTRVGWWSYAPTSVLNLLSSDCIYAPP